MSLLKFSKSFETNSKGTSVGPNTPNYEWSQTAQEDLKFFNWISETMFSEGVQKRAWGRVHMLRTGKRDSSHNNVMEAFNNDDIDMIEYDEDDAEDAPEQYVPHNQIHLIKRSGKNYTLCTRLFCK